MAAALRPRPLAPGEVLMREGEPGDTFALLVEGQVAVTRAGRHRAQDLAVASAGSILGELAVLRGRPRTATITALTPALAAVGTGPTLFELLDHPQVLDRLRHLASARLAHDLRPVHVTLPDRTPIRLRPLLPEDRTGFGAAVGSMSPDSRRRRFFSSGQLSAEVLEYLVDVDFVDHFAWLVLDEQRTGLATARYVRHEEDHELAEVAFGVVDHFQGRGVGTLLLGAIGVAAAEAGIRRIEGYVQEDNAPMRAVFAKAGGVSAFDEPGVIRVEVDPVGAADLLPSGPRRELQAAVHDVVTAASLALMDPG